jgi:hypothetical protein
MHLAEILSLLLALSVAVNIAITAYLIARVAGAATAQAILTGAGAAATGPGLYLPAVAAYH